MKAWICVVGILLSGCGARAVAAQAGITHDPDTGTLVESQPPVQTPGAVHVRFSHDWNGIGITVDAVTIPLPGQSAPWASDDAFGYIQEMEAPYRTFPVRALAGAYGATATIETDQPWTMRTYQASIYYVAP